MELSEHELRVLQELEDDLQAGSPRLARSLGGNGRPGPALRHFVLGTAGMGLGIGLMCLALVLRSVPVGALAFATMTAGAYLAAPPRARFGVRLRPRGNRDDSRSTSEQ
jgi:hypothetical protein